ncbi:MAG: aspartate aminotransferase family protein [Kyrpidia tusciae]|nr:aspartate aminotransferase family protein [Kyrpidia tusciae]MBE3551505.1 aspartate aminotransferase family protein [Kyrpidia tusciae]
MVNSVAVKDLYDSYINPGLAKLYHLMGLSAGELRGEGSLVYDEDGKRYIDCVSGYGSLPFGHRPRPVLEAVRRQMDRMALSSKVMPGRPAGELAEALAGWTPGDLQYSFFCNSGAEAVEGALKLARAVTGRPGFVAAEGGFHGKTFGALSVSGRQRYRAPFHPLLPGVTLVPFGDVEALKRAVSQQTAAVILEPIQGEGGVHPAPRGYLAAAREICDRAGALLILDEVQTGFGRTGMPFAAQREGVVPDVMCLAKALGGGVMPIGCFIARPEAARAFWEDPLIHTSTFGGNPLAAAAGLATLDWLRREDLPGAAAETGRWLKGEFEEMAKRYPGWIREVRGEGLLLGVEFVDEARGGLVMSGLVEKGVLTAFTLNEYRVVRVEPSLTIDRGLLIQVLEAWDAVLGYWYGQLGPGELEGTGWEPDRQVLGPDSTRGDESGETARNAGKEGDGNAGGSGEGVVRRALA